MIKLYVSIVLFSLLCSMGCGTFPTSYAIIEPDKPRLLDFIYEPAEAAPGDTVTLTAVFAGRPVQADELTWQMSGNVIVSEYGAMTVLDTMPLEVQYQDVSFSDSTSCISFTFVVPAEILSTSPYIPERWTDLLPDYYQSALPEALPTSKQQILELLDLASSPEGVAFLQEDTTALQYLPMLLQLMSVPMQIYCGVHNSHPIRSQFVVRYNSRFSDIPGLHVPVNRNPHIDSTVLYCVNKTDLLSFDPDSSNYTFTKTMLYSDSVNALIIDRKKSYFIAIYNNRIDTTLSIDGAMGESKPLTETISSHWYLQYSDSELDKVGNTERIQIENGVMFGKQVLSRFYPSLSDDITSIVCWVEVTDSFLNEMNRPTGSTLGEYRLSFTYSK